MNELVAVFGVAGVGKTELIVFAINCMPGLTRIFGGDLIRKGREIVDLDRDVLARLPNDEVLIKN